MFFHELHCLLYRTLFVRADCETEERGIDAKSVFGDVDTRTRCWHALHANKNVHVGYLALHASIGWVKQRLATDSCNLHWEQLVHVHHAQFVAFNGMFWCEVGEEQVLAK